MPRLFSTLLLFNGKTHYKIVISIFKIFQRAAADVREVQSAELRRDMNTKEKQMVIAIFRMVWSILERSPSQK